MTPMTRLAGAWAVFDQLADVPAEEREAVLRAACGDDLALRRRGGPAARPR